MLLNHAATFIKLWEKFEELPYDDGSGNPTIGYGFTYYLDGTPVQMSDAPMSRATGDQMLESILSEIANQLYAGYPFWNNLNIFKKSALISFAYNTGYRFGDGNHDTLDRALESDLYSVPGILPIYCKANGEPLLGLQRRRMAEAALWEGVTPEIAYSSYQEWEPNLETKDCGDGICAIAPELEVKPKGGKSGKKTLAQKLDM